MTRWTAIVTDAGRGSAISIIRSLGRSGWRVVATDHDPLSPGFRSRYASLRRRVPDPMVDASGYAQAIVGIARSCRADLVIPVTEASAISLAKVRDDVDSVAALAAPSNVAFDVTRDKWASYELAQRLAIPAPRTILAEDVDSALTAAEELGYPVVLKPRYSRLLDGASICAFAVTYGAGPDGVREAMRALGGRTAMLVQQYVEGEGHGVELLLDEGRVVAAFQHRRLREVPVTGGASAYRESVPLDPAMYRDAIALLDALRWTGLAMVEFRVGPAGHHLIEINGRIWGSLPLAGHSGLDFGRLLAEVWLHRLGHTTPEPQPGSPARSDLPGYSIGVRSHDLGLELAWIGSVLSGRRRHPFLPHPPRSAAIGAIASLVDPTSRHDVLSIDDPGPGLADIVRVTRHLLMKIARG